MNANKTCFMSNTLWKGVSDVEAKYQCSVNHCFCDIKVPRVHVLNVQEKQLLLNNVYKFCDNLLHSEKYPDHMNVPKRFYFYCFKILPEKLIHCLLISLTDGQSKKQIMAPKSDSLPDI